MILLFYRNLCEIIIEISIRIRTYENTFKEPVPLEEEGLSREDVDPEGIVLLCSDCGKNVYPLDWISKMERHGKVDVDTLVLMEQECVRCFASTRRVVDMNECDICNKKK